MRATLTIVISLVATSAMIGLCVWESSRVTRLVVVAPKQSGVAGSSVKGSGSVPEPPFAGSGAQGESESSDGVPASSEEADLDPTFSGDEYLRAEMEAILAEASLALPDVLAEQPPASAPAPSSSRPPADHETGRHWSFRPLRQVAVPSVSDTDAPGNPIDAFIRAGLVPKKLDLNQFASAAVLIRRLSYDLRGLPPDLKDLDVWRERFGDADVPSGVWSEAKQEMYGRLVEKYLADSAYGEHWARVWLDVARYADSDGYEVDDLRPNAYPYRDFVIWAWNNDLPYNRFVQWQIAGDELAPRFAPAIAATGFLAAAPHNTFMPQPSERYDELHDIISTIGSGVLGLSVGCARCHDHFYDPIPTREYYQIVAVFESAARDEQYLASPLAEPGAADYSVLIQPLVDREEELQELLEKRIRHDKVSRLDFTEEEKAILLGQIESNAERREDLLSRCGGCLRVDASDFVDGLEPLPEDADRYRELEREVEQLRASLPPAPPQALIMTGSRALDTHVLAGGSLKRKGKRVHPGFLSALTATRVDWDHDAWRRWRPDDGDGNEDQPRSAFALWMTDVREGAGALVARVIVNRIWQQYFGRGLVATANDFGAQGAEPTHPELLEWLANELVSNGWSLKHIHRLIVTSKTYRQSSRADQTRLTRDPDNALVSRYRRKRLTAEMLRDSVLSASGSLNRSMYGPSIFPPIPPDAIYSDDYELDSKWPTDIEEGPAVWRRSIYVALRRSNTVPLLTLFDGPDGGMCRARRAVTTSPVQSLALLNSPFVRGQAERLAERLSNESIDLEVQIRLLYSLVFQREPTVDEFEDIYELIRRRRSESAEVYDVDVMTDVCHALFMSNEFLYVD